MKKYPIVPKNPADRNSASCGKVGVCQNHRPNGVKQRAPTTLCHSTTTAGLSRPDTTLATRLEPAISGTAASIIRMPGFTSTTPGRTITSMPTNPTPTPAQRRQCTVSRRKITAPTVTKIGPVKLSAAMVASGSHTTASYHRP